MGGGASVALNNQASGREYGLITPQEERRERAGGGEKWPIKMCIWLRLC